MYDLIVELETIRKEVMGEESAKELEGLEALNEDDGEDTLTGIRLERAETMYWKVRGY